MDRHAHASGAMRGSLGDAEEWQGEIDGEKKESGQHPESEPDDHTIAPGMKGASSSCVKSRPGQVLAGLKSR